MPFLFAVIFLLLIQAGAGGDLWPMSLVARLLYLEDPL